MSHRGQAQLAIWSDIHPDQETDYLHWLTREHVLERVGVDGFLSGRVFRSEVAGKRRFFITYELQEAAALAGPSYLARLNAPTPWSQRVMPILQNFARGGGPVVARAGLGCGAVAVPLRLDLETAGLLDEGAQRTLVERIVKLDAVAQVWLSGAWHFVDATGMCRANSLALIAVGRDACEVAFMETASEARMLRQVVQVTQAA